MNDNYIQIRIPTSLKNDFKKLCKENNTDPSHEIKQYIANKVKVWSNKSIRYSKANNFKPSNH